LPIQHWFDDDDNDDDDDDDDDVDVLFHFLNDNSYEQLPV